MNKYSVLLVSVAFCFVSCKSAQRVSNNQTYQPQPQPQNSVVNEERGQQLEQDICEILQEEKPGLRAVGNAQHFKLSTAKNMAALQARAELAAALETMIINAMRDGTTQDQQYAGDNQQGKSVTDGLGVSEQDLKALANGIVKNTVIIKTSTYLKSNRQYNVYVCVEYSDGPKQIAKETVSKIKQMIPEDKKAELNSRLDRLNQNIEDSLSRVTNE